MTLVQILLFLAVAAIIFSKFYFSKKAIIKRQLKKMPVRPLGSVAEGETARITGKAVLVGEPLIAPLSGRECCHYHVLIEQKVSTGKSSYWKTIVEEEKGTDYLVEDDGSHACLDAKEPMTYLVQDRSYKSGLFNDATEKLSDYMRLHGIDTEDMLGLNKTLRYYEGIIEPGESVTALGKGRWKHASSIGFPEHYGIILNMSADEEKKYLFISDDKKITLIN